MIIKHTAFSKAGFTLAEILVVMAIVAVVGTIMVIIFTNTLRGSNKSQVISVIKQNGQAALDNMSGTIRNADDIICFAASFPGNTIVTVQDHGTVKTYTRYRIVLYTDVDGTAPGDCTGPGKNGCIVQDHPKPQDLGYGMYETNSQFRNRVCSASDPMPQSGSTEVNILTDTSYQTGVQVHSGSFAVSKPSGFKAAVTINFILKPGIGAPQSIAGQIDPIPFQTTVNLR